MVLKAARSKWGFRWRQSEGLFDVCPDLAFGLAEKRLRIVRRPGPAIPTRMIAIQKTFPRERILLETAAVGVRALRCA